MSEAGAEAIKTILDIADHESLRSPFGALTLQSILNVSRQKCQLLIEDGLREGVLRYNSEQDYLVEFIR